MKDTRSQPTPTARPTLSAAALEEWSRHVDAILRGVGHALNNRAAALSAAVQLGDDPEEAAGVIRTILQPELARVTELAAAVRSLGPPRGGDEAFSPKDAAAEALQVLALHADQREIGVTIDAGRASPVRAQRWMFVRALVVLGGCGCSTRLSASDDGDWVVVRSNGRKPECRASAYITEIAAAMGGESVDDGAGFRVLTLAALRKREGR